MADNRQEECAQCAAIRRVTARPTSTYDALRAQAVRNMERANYWPRLSAVYDGFIQRGMEVGAIRQVDVGRMPDHYSEWLRQREVSGLARSFNHGKGRKSTIPT